MDFEKIADKCTKLNKKYGFLHAVFVVAFILSLAALFFYIISPIIFSIFSAQTAGFLFFVIPLGTAIFGLKVAKQERLDKILDSVYKQSKINLTLGTLSIWIVLQLKPLLLNKPQDNGK
jgi:hypothetical protein